MKLQQGIITFKVYRSSIGVRFFQLRNIWLNKETFITVLHLKIPHNHTKYRGEKNNVIKTEKCFKKGKKGKIIKTKRKEMFQKKEKNVSTS
jgi:hypothetical protein